MEEVFLYGCELCQSVVFLYNDCGNHHLHMCKSCTGGTFHNKIVLKGVEGEVRVEGFGVVVKETNYVFALEEKKDGDKKEE